MKSAQFRIGLVIFITVVAAGLVFRVKHLPPLENPKFFEFPLSIGKWSGREIPMSPWVYQGIETPFLFLRNYYAPDHDIPVNLSIVWFDDKNIAFHTPEACLGGLGEKVQEKKIIKIRLQEEFEGVRDLVVLNGKRYMVIYYFDMDGYRTPSQISLRMRVLGRRLLFKRASSSFIRVMAPIGESLAKTEELLLEFLRDALPLIPEYTYTERLNSRLSDS